MQNVIIATVTSFVIVLIDYLTASEAEHAYVYVGLWMFLSGFGYLISCGVDKVFEHFMKGYEQ